MLRVDLSDRGTPVFSFVNTKRLNVLNCDKVEHTVKDNMGKPGTNIILNLKDIDFIDSQGFDLLLKLTEYSLNKGVGFYLANINDEARELIKLVQLDSVFQEYLLEDDWILDKEMMYSLN